LLPFEPPRASVAPTPNLVTCDIAAGLAMMWLNIEPETWPKTLPNLNPKSVSPSVLFKVQ
jgi:hypothetical protein